MLLERWRVARTYPTSQTTLTDFRETPERRLEHWGSVPQSVSTNTSLELSPLCPPSNLCPLPKSFGGFGVRTKVPHPANPLACSVTLVYLSRVHSNPAKVGLELKQIKVKLKQPSQQEARKTPIRHSLNIGGGG